MRARQSVPAEPQFVTGLHDLTLWFLQCTNRYPKNWRISLGDRIDSLLIEMATQAQVARLRQNKLPLLTELSDKIEVLRVLTRLSVALHSGQTHLKAQ